jgi:Uma2 family endonuclease
MVVEMTAPERLRPRYSYAEYLAYERDSELKHEFDDGEIVAMAGGRGGRAGRRA